MLVTTILQDNGQSYLYWQTGKKIDNNSSTEAWIPNVRQVIQVRCPKPVGFQRPSYGEFTSYVRRIDNTFHLTVQK